MLTAVEGLGIAAMAAVVTWFVLRKRGMAVPARPRKHPGIMVNAWERTAAQINYDADIRKTVTCEHLQPVERAIRAAEIDVHLFDPPRGPIIRAECHIHEAALKREFPSAARLEYKEEYRPEVSDREEPRAYLICHYFDEPWFPSPPAGH